MPCQAGMIDRYEADIVGAGFQAHASQPIRIEKVRRRWFVLRKRAQALDSRGIGKHRDLHKPAYAASYPARAPDGACVGVEACICSYQNVSTKSTRGVSGC